MTKYKQDFELFANTDHLLNFIITASDNVTGQSLTNCPVRWVLQDEIDSTCWLYNASTSNGVVVNGSLVSVTIQASRTTGLSSGWYYHELKLLTSGSVEVLAVGIAKVNRSSG